MPKILALAKTYYFRRKEDKPGDDPVPAFWLRREGGKPINDTRIYMSAKKNSRLFTKSTMPERAALEDSAKKMAKRFEGHNGDKRIIVWR